MDTSARQLARQLSASLSSASPHFLKQLSSSHVSGRFRFGIPKEFCRVNLPDHNSQVVLVDDNDDEYETSYKFDTSSLSGPGWRDFSTSHALMERDYLVFELVDDCKFKVNIVRHNPVQEVPVQEPVQEVPVEEDYNILVAGESINEEIDLHCRVKYHELCSSQDTILHSSVLEFVDIKVVAGMIIETTRIVDRIRDITGTSDVVEELKAWDVLLENFERIGMKVRFIRARIAQLITLQQADLVVLEASRLETAELSDKMRRLIAEFDVVKERRRALDAEDEAIAAENMRRAEIIREVANALW